jgi:hypothetical protein
MSNKAMIDAAKEAQALNEPIEISIQIGSIAVSKELLEAYRYWRSYNPVTKDGYRWIENVSPFLRLVGFADEIAGLNHTGWYLDNECPELSELARGIVYQLPHDRFVPGVADLYNDNCALLDFSNLSDDKEDAARVADEMARIYAENESEYQSSWRAGEEFAGLGKSISENRREILEFCRGHRNASGAPLKAICEAVKRRLKRIRMARQRRAEIESGYWNEEAFRDGAGL